MLQNVFPAGDWQCLFDSFKKSKSFENLDVFLTEEYSTNTVCPPAEQIFEAFSLTPFKEVKVLILGQDPYHGLGQAHGLAFSVKAPCKTPPSLKNIFKEIGFESSLGDLTHWAQQGVLLLNTVLTVRESQAHSHRDKGWENFTDAVIEHLSTEKNKMIFVLWGGPAQKKESLIDSSKHEVLMAPHPSPLSAYRGFFGCGHFEKINQILRQQGMRGIKWELEDKRPKQMELF